MTFRYVPCYRHVSTCAIAFFVHAEQARSICWSPDCGHVTVVGEQGTLQLWALTAGDSRASTSADGSASASAGPSGLALLHVFHDYPTHSMQWHQQVGEDGAMLLARCVHV